MARSSKIDISTYLSRNFTKSFLTIFLPLFFIGSLVFIIKISALTASIQINFIEMMRLFGYNLPAILFYTMPVSFLVAVVMTLLRLSNENELMALFALGASAKFVLYRFFVIATLFSIILLILSLGLMPKTKQQYNAFKYEKSTHAQVNIHPSKLGQKFGNLFVYVKDKKNDSLNHIAIYNKDSKHSDQLFIAENAKIENRDSVVTLTLNRGSGYTFTGDALREVNYEKMQIFQNLNTKAFTYSSILNYWIQLSLNPKKRSKILFFIFTSLIPMMALAIVASFSIINPRYQKNYAYQVLALTTITLYGIASFLKRDGTLFLFTLFVTVTFLLGILLYRHYVLRFL